MKGSELGKGGRKNHQAVMMCILVVLVVLAEQTDVTTGPRNLLLERSLRTGKVPED